MKLAINYNLPPIQKENTYIRKINSNGGILIKERLKNDLLLLLKFSNFSQFDSLRSLQNFHNMLL